MHEDVEELVKQLEALYPRAANNIRTFWGAEEDCKTFFTTLLSNTTGKNQVGFSFEAMRLIDQIHDKYVQQLEQFKKINKSKDELQIMDAVEKNVWSKPEFKHK